MSLEEYKKKRNFDSTSEPVGEVGTSSYELKFVVQRHAASHLHYDFRLEMQGVLKSWAIPKGPSMNPSDKRLAMMTEDHPMSYAKFEGTIPKGNYGAGEIEVWDEGTYEPINKKPDKTNDLIMRHELHEQSMKFILYGKKLKGEFALVKIKNAEQENAWLLIKHKDEFAVSKYDAELHTEKNSRVTKYLEEKKSSKKKIVNLRTEEDFPDQISPMLAKISEEAFDKKGWLFEIKWDGYRAIADIRNRIQLYSRNGVDFSSKFPEIALGLGEQKHEMVLDGEIVAYDENGYPSFQSIQNFDDEKTAIIYHVFDLLWLNGHPTISLGLEERKELLAEALIETQHIKYLDHIEEDGIAFFKQIKKMNLEGMMAKKKNSTYDIGHRSNNWLKIKHLNHADVYIMGYTKPKGSRKHFGALILGVKQNKGFVHAGNVGSGFDEKTLKDLFNQMQPLVTKENFFVNKRKPATNEIYIKPDLLAQIKFTEKTEKGQFRHPVYLGLREDLLESAPMRGLKVVKRNPLETVEKTKVSQLYPHHFEVNISNPSKIYWPDSEITKLQLIDYYQKVSAFILPHIQYRPQSMNRHPDGINGKNFFQKDAPDFLPSEIPTAKIYSESTERYIDYILCNNASTLKYMNNLGCIEINPWPSKVFHLDHPDYLMLDLDPSSENTFDEVIEVALEAHNLLNELGLTNLVKTSGSSGIHIYLPLNAQYTFGQSKDFAFLLMQELHNRIPKITTLERSLSKRPKKAIYLDYLQNRRGQTLASVYSLRPKIGASVSTPLAWEEVKTGIKPQDFNIFNVPDRLNQYGDLFADILGKGIDMLEAMEKLEGLK